MRYHALCPRLLICRNTHFRITTMARMVFADTPSGKDKDGSEKDEKDRKEKDKKKERVTVSGENARTVLDDLIRENKIDGSAKEKATKILEKGSEEDKKKLRDFLQKGVDGTLVKSELRTFLTEAEKKLPAEKGAKKEEKKEKDEKDVAAGVKDKIFGKTSEGIVTTQRLAESLKGSQNERQKEIAKRMTEISGDFKKLNDADREAVKAVQKKLNDMVEAKQITQDQAEQLLKLDFNSDGWKDKWDELTKNVTDAKARVGLDDFQKLKKTEATAEKHAEKEYEEKMKEVRFMMNEIGQEMMDQAHKEKTLKVLSLAAGFPLKKGQILRYDQMEGSTDVGGKPLELKRRHATIKDVRFEEIEVTDEAGKVVKKLNPTAPVIIVESYDPDTGKMAEQKWSPQQLLEWSDINDATEDVSSIRQLEESIGDKLHIGDSFEYRELKNVDQPNYGAEDHTVKIKRINLDKGEIELDEKVIISPTENKKSKYVTFGQFAKWYKRNEAMRPIESLEKLRTELRAYNEAQNTIYNRDAAHFPAIEVKPGEVLKYDDNSGRKFVIKEATDKKITFDTGDTFTPASFLRWVKKNEVEKSDAKAEGLKAAAPIQDELEKMQVRKEVQNQEEQANAERIENGARAERGEELPPGAVLDRPEEPAEYSVSYIRRLWDNTTLMSLSDFWEMGKTLVEWVKRKWKRWKHGRVGTVGQHIFGWMSTELGGEFKSMFKHAENEEVNHHVEHYKTMGIDFLKHEMHEAPNKDILKAAMTALAEKGQLRFDDPGLWESVNHLSHGIPCTVNRMTHVQDMEKVFDEWWGQDTFRELRNKNDSSYNSIKKNFEDNSKRLEGDPFKNGGLRAALQILLQKHLRGEYVNPAEYEEYLHYAIYAGKLSFEDKLYFLVMGIGAAPHGGGLPLFHIDRAGAIESDLLRNFPVLDFFTSKRDFEMVDADGKPLYAMDPETGKVAVDEKGKPKRKLGKADINLYKHWIKQYVMKDAGGSLQNYTQFKEFAPGTNFKQFIDEVALMDDDFLKRLNKAVSSSDNWDHDDMDKFAPRLGEESVEQLTLKQGGAKQNTTVEGLKNSYAGFNDFTAMKLRMLQRHLGLDKDHPEERNPEAAQEDIRHIMNGMRSFIRFDAILDRRYDHDASNRSRLGSQELSAKAVNDTSRPVKWHVEEMRRFIKDLAQEFGLGDKAYIVFNNYGFIPAAKDRELQKNTVGEFGKMLEGAMFHQAEHPEKLFALFEKIQKKNSADHMEIKGIINKPAAKVVERVEKESSALTPFKHGSIEEKVRTIKLLNEKLATTIPRTPAEIETAHEGRVQEVMGQVEKGTFINPQEEDAQYLDEKIAKLQQELKKKEIIQTNPEAPPPAAATPENQNQKKAA